MREIDGAGRSGSIDVHAEKCLDRSEGMNGEGLGELLIDEVDFGDRFGENEEVINVDCDNRGGAGDVLSKEERFVGVRLLKAEICEGRFNEIRPEVGGLFETVETFEEAEDIIFGGVLRIIIAGGLFCEDIFVERRD